MIEIDEPARVESLVNKMADGVKKAFKGFKKAEIKMAVADLVFNIFYEDFKTSNAELFGFVVASKFDSKFESKFSGLYDGLKSAYKRAREAKRVLRKAFKEFDEAKRALESAIDKCT